MTPERRQALVGERDFLLASLRDLDREHAAGDVDDTDYAALKDGYTARAAAVLRQLEHGDAGADLDQPTRRSRLRLVGWVALVVAVAAAAGALVTANSGDRMPGQVASGNVESDSVSGLLARARGQLNPSEPGPAIELYGQVLDLEPSNVEALTYLGWLSVLSAFQSTDAEEGQKLFTTGVTLLRQATTIDATYSDPHCFLGIAFKRTGDAEAAAPEFQECLDLNPPAQMRTMVENALADVDSAPADSAPADSTP